MADGNIEIDTKLNTDGVADQVNKLSDKINKLADNKTLTAFSKLGSSVTGLQSAFSMVTGTVKKVNAAVKETTQLYRTQVTAEKQLEQAAKNNPYLNSESVSNLKQYASYLQSIGTVGDETLLPMMAQLASTGRDQTEIQNIMSAALDLSASGMMSLDSAVTQLNATYSGNIGLMGRQITELKGLTDEELKSGKAIQIVQEKYKGMAAETTKVAGSSEQLKNAIGDYKEELGASFEKPLIPLRKFFTELIGGWADAKRATREYEEAKEKAVEGKAESSDYAKLLEEEKKQQAHYNEEVQKYLALLNDEDALNEKIRESRGYFTADSAKKALVDAQKQYEVHTANVNLYQAELNAQKELEEAKVAADQKAKAEAEAKQKQLAEEKAAMEKRDELRAQYDETIRAAQEEINQRKILGEEITEEAEATELLNVATSAYIKMMSDPAFEGNSGNWTHEVEARKQIAEWTEQAKLDYSELKEQLEGFSSTAQKSVIDSLKEQLSNLDLLGEKLKEFPDLYQQYADKRIEIENAITQAQKENLSTQISQINDYMSKYSDITTGITSLIRSSNEDQADAEMGALSEQYNDGLISYEEYCEKKKELDKKQAQEEYKLKMWEWTTSLLTATANIAQGVSAALAQTPPASYVMAALTAASGAVQIAAITANKPQMPKFAHGGVVQGGNFNDGITAHVSSGEMILNSAQQMNLWKAANGNGGTGGANITMPVSIQNNAGANVSAQMSKNGLIVMVDEVVNSSMQAGHYTESMNVAQSRASGISYY